MQEHSQNENEEMVEDLILLEEDDDLVQPAPKKRKHSVWRQPWITSKEDEGQCNTAYKFQKELIDVSIF